ncbi:MAG: crossover junction endodeoxyribonuclease RuvC [Verrucomicrobiota bacterium]
MNQDSKIGLEPRSVIRILGLDTALRNTGYGLIDTDGYKFTVIDCGLIQTARTALLSKCLSRLSEGVQEITASFNPQTVAIESGFYHKNAKTAMLLGSARGAVIAPLAMTGLSIYQYSPRRIKQAVCGYGNASKQQIAGIVGQLLTLDTADIRDDVTDALAIAVCHAHTYFTNQGCFLPAQV